MAAAIRDTTSAMPGPGLPTGTVAFVFTDIEGSTRLAHEQPQAFTSLLQRHNQLLRSAFESGAEVGTAGDALFVAFSAIGDALSAAAAGQRMLAAEPWPDGVEVRVRMGVHVGVAEVAEDTYMGVEVHRAARICAAAHGGQVLVSQAAAQLHGASPDLSLRSLGDYRLKDFDEPQELFQLGGKGLLERFPPPRTAEARVVSLPRESTSLVGRDRELAEIRRLVMDNRLTTLTGTGGSGKSRLAMRVARDLAPRFRGPVVFVSLAPLADADSAPSTLATALGLGGMFATWQDAIDVLRPQNALIVWDNAEHLPGLSLRLRELCDDCERLHCLVTSRSSLGVVGEQLFTVEPLAPDARLSCWSIARGSTSPTSTRPPWTMSCARSRRGSTACRSRWSWPPPACEACGRPPGSTRPPARPARRDAGQPGGTAGHHPRHAAVESRPA